jgi:hypothetical protein
MVDRRGTFQPGHTLVEQVSRQSHLLSSYPSIRDDGETNPTRGA